MYETLVNFDRDLFLIINGLHTEFLDSFMWWTAERFVWIPLYVLLIVFLYRKFGRQSLVMVFFSVLLILLSDQGSVLMKNTFERLRPCQDDSLSFLVHTVKNKCGGKYGFVSSHAANTMAVFVYMLLLARNSSKAITIITLLWVLLTGYNRVYMGVHFPADVAGGWIIGAAAACITYLIYRLIFVSPAEFLKKT
jgi:undecaprenyl-diphosphatase